MCEFSFYLLIICLVEKEDDEAHVREKAYPPRSSRQNPKDHIQLYETARTTVEMMIKIAKRKGFLFESTIIGELCEGHKAITKVLEEYGYNVIGRDKYYFYDSWQSFDIYIDQFPEGINLILTNPPYDEKERLLKRLYESGILFSFSSLILLVVLLIFLLF